MSELLMTVSVNAAPVRSATATPEMLVMDDQLYIHNMTPELARQWIGVLEPLAEGN
ncbi:hypothetical protein PP637_gp64 [Arthrobacter phage Persistence]|uniref:Uncharacterized protein n=1 Tax=Arthrobacter phage Persistence TaxID=2836007 RepID=A0A8F3E1J1_9CAUD|nr:hypothetical protein PP637_gp64 [Arthrobacter phage Persistence]QWY79692.1 hypothetical protein SEA_PERSISTENCE_64 [Arthrobacter phage Persistence]